MADTDKRISESELQVLQLLWEESPLAATDVADRLADKRWSLTTIKTLLSRLVAKGAATAEAQGRRYLYRPMVDRDTVAARQAVSLVDRLFGGRVSPLVAHLAERRELDDKDLQELEALIRSLKK